MPYLRGMAYSVIIETQRLLLRKFTPDDVQLIYNLNNDQEVTRFTHDPVWNLNHAKEILEKNILPQYTLYNHGRWAVHLKPNHEFIGWCGLKYRPELDEVDLGYRFMKQFWGRGYATEAAFASIKYGFEKLNLLATTGRAEPANIASCKVLERCGMLYIGMQHVDGYDLQTYITRNPLNQ
jgi:[ribosomal protein S5]-alanine N-acetyltransferase